MPLWRRTFFKLPAWGWIGIFLLFIVFVATNASDKNDDEVSAAVVVGQPSPSDAVPAPTAQAAQSVGAPETTFAPLSVEQVQQVFSIVFDNQRGDIISIVRDDPAIESVDVLDYNQDTGVVRLEVTPLFDFDEGVRDDAWRMTRAFGAFYLPGGPWVNIDPPWSPTLEVKVSSAHYACSGDQLQQVADSRFSRDDWESACRVG